MTGPGINNFDLSLGKAFRFLGEGREIQVRAESFNVFNHTQWSSIGTPGYPPNQVVDDRGSNPASQFGYVSARVPAATCKSP